MTTWTVVSDQSTSYENPTDIDNNYVLIGYVQNDYILTESIWSVASNVSTAWA